MSGPDWQPNVDEPSLACEILIGEARVCVGGQYGVAMLRYMSPHPPSTGFVAVTTLNAKVIGVVSFK